MAGLDAIAAAIAAQLAPVDARLASRYPDPGPGSGRWGVQPAHTVYIPADQLTAELPRRWGDQALELLDQQYGALHAALGADADAVLVRVRRKLETSPVDDLRVDFEDGYGFRPDEVETADGIAAAQVLLEWARTGEGPGTVGIRAKGLGPKERARGLVTLDTVIGAAAATLADRFVFTVPKLRDADQVDAVTYLCAALEARHGLASGSLRFELQIESPQAIVDGDGVATVAAALHRSAGRCSGLHYGTYDYSAGIGIVAAHQSLDHPVADHAKAVMQIAAAQTGVWVSDGSTQVFPVGPDAGANLVRHLRLVTRSLERGIYQGWDMHPGQLVSRWAATFAFFRNAATVSAPRLQRYLERATAPADAAIVDEPATAEALAATLKRALDVGALDSDELLGMGSLLSVANLNRVIRRESLL